MKKILALLALIFLMQTPVQAAEVDSKCFSAEQCTTEGGRFEKHPLCPGAFGLCYAPQPTVKLNLAVGGKTTVQGIGEFLGAMYNYFVGVGVILAIILVMVGGLRWTASAGSAEKVGAAKKMISSAISGLVLLLSSYLILFTINPALVSFKVPQVPMTRREVAVSKETSCQALNMGPYALKTEGKVYDEVQQSEFNLKDPECGKEYFVKEGGGSTCQGNWCASPTACYNGACKQAAFAGKVTAKDIPTPYIDNDMKIVVLCVDGTILDVYQEDVDDLNESSREKNYLRGEFEYAFDVQTDKIAAQVKDCDVSHGGTSGVTLAVEINDTGSFLGIDTPGSDDWYGLGRNLEAAKNGNCVLDFNLCNAIPDKTARDFCLEWDFDHEEGLGDKMKDYLSASDQYNYWKDGGTSAPQSTKVAYYNDKTVNPNPREDGTAGCARDMCLHLIPPEIAKRGVTCEVRLDRAVFPSK